MSNINQLSGISEISAGDLLVLWDQSSGDSRKAAISLLQSYLQSNLSFATDNSYTTVYAAPVATAFTVTLKAANNENLHLILTPTGTFAAGTIALPASPADKQEVLINCTQEVTSLTLDAGIFAIAGAPSGLAANAFFRLKYDQLYSTWFRVG